MVLSLVMIVALHGSSAFKIFLIMFINFSIAMNCRGSWLGPVLTWIFNGLVLFTNDIYHGYQFSSLGSNLSYLVFPPYSCLSNTTPNIYCRMASRASTLAGMSCSISRCFDLSRSIWTTIGHVRIEKF